MQPWVVLDRVETGDGLLELRGRADDDFLITIDGRVLMNSRAHRSEVGLAQLGCRGLASGRAPRVLIGGLGMGYTLRATLDCLPTAARVVVAELNQRVVAWCEGPLAALTADAVRDRRVEVRVEDVAKTIADALGARRFSAILFDLYEGPDDRNLRRDPLYGEAVLQRIRDVLEPGGTFAVWSEKPSAGFEKNLRTAGFRVARKRLGRGGLRHAIYLATAPGK